jgi:hypothetical protein
MMTVLVEDGKVGESKDANEKKKRHAVCAWREAKKEKKKRLVLTRTPNGFHVDSETSTLLCNPTRDVECPRPPPVTTLL